MARVTYVEKARKDQGPCTKCQTEIKAGDKYCWWKFLRGSRHVRCSKPECKPKASDLTQSAFYATLFDLGDTLQAGLDEFRQDGDGSALSSVMEEVAGDLRTLGEDCREKYDNMPDGLKEGGTGELLNTRAEECDSKADELESASSEVAGYEDPEDEDEREGARDDAASEADIDLSID